MMNPLWARCFQDVTASGYALLEQGQRYLQVSTKVHENSHSVDFQFSTLYFLYACDKGDQEVSKFLE